MRTVTEPSRQDRAVVVDPRIRKRQIDVRRAEGRRRLRVLTVVVIVVLLVAGALAATRTPLLDVDRIVV